MSGPPLQCSKCGHQFESGAIDAAVADTVTLVDVRVVEPCPRCGAEVDVNFSATYTVGLGGWRDLGRALRPDRVTVEDYRSLARALTEAANTAAGSEVRVGSEATAAAVEQVPLFDPLAQWIRVHPQTSQWLVTTLIGVLTLVLSRFPASSTSLPTVTAPTPRPAVEAPREAPTAEQVQQWIRDAIAAHEQAEQSRGRGDQAPGR